MIRSCAVAVVVTALVAAASVADARPAVRQGVPVDSLTPAGMQRVRVRAPSAAGQPVRLGYATAGRGRVEVLIDVRVAADAAAAHAALAHWRHQASRELPTIAGFADEAYGTGALIAFVRDNIMVAVRVVGGDRPRDVSELALGALAAVQAAPRGRPRPAVSAAASSLAAGEGVDVATPEGALDADLRVSGPARARRTAQGWRVTRIGDGEVALRMVVVDSLLRVSTTR